MEGKTNNELRYAECWNCEHSEIVHLVDDYGDDVPEYIRYCVHGGGHREIPNLSGPHPEWCPLRHAAAPVIVTRHAGQVEWLRRQGVTGTVIGHVDRPDQIAGKVVFGILPLHLAAEARLVVATDFPRLRPEQRGKDLTPEQMDAAGANPNLRCYRVQAYKGSPSKALDAEAGEEIPRKSSTTTLKAWRYSRNGAAEAYVVEFSEHGYRVVSDDRKNQVSYLHLCDASADKITDACRNKIIKYMFDHPDNLPGIGKTAQHKYFGGLTATDIERIGNGGRKAYYNSGRSL